MKLKQLALCALLITLVTSTNANQTNRCTIELNGLQETPSIYTLGKGVFSAVLDKVNNSLSYTLRFSNLSSRATVAHIHFGQIGVAGGVMAFLCGGGGKPACPPNGVPISGTITAADIHAIPSQGVAAGNFKALLVALHTAKAYANVHTIKFPTGEIRGQVWGFFNQKERK